MAHAVQANASLPPKKHPQAARHEGPHPAAWYPFLSALSESFRWHQPLMASSPTITVSTSMKCGSNLLLRHPLSSLQGTQPTDAFTMRKVLLGFKAFASRKHERKRRNGRKSFKDTSLISEGLSSSTYEDQFNKTFTGDADVSTTGDKLLIGDADASVQVASANRTAVLRGCIATSAVLCSLGAVVRQISHVASEEGWPVLDSTEVSYSFEIWHMELIIGLVILISSSRYILLKMWPDFAESSEAANRQILTSLRPLDYAVVAFLPGISEELLFRGALMPIFGLNWVSALAIGAVFGCLHLGSGRRYSYVIWATFVGFAYGLGEIASSSVVVPMVSHSLNNLIGGILWRFTSNPQEGNK